MDVASACLPDSRERLGGDGTLSFSGLTEFSFSLNHSSSLPFPLPLFLLLRLFDDFSFTFADNLVDRLELDFECFDDELLRDLSFFESLSLFDDLFSFFESFAELDFGFDEFLGECFDDERLRDLSFFESLP